MVQFHKETNSKYSSPPGTTEINKGTDIREVYQCLQPFFLLNLFSP